MKRFLILLAVLIVVIASLLIVNDRLVKYLVFTSSNANMYRMCRLFNEQFDEVAIVGSSRAEANFAPTEIGDNVFNYGISGSLQGETLVHLKALIRRGGDCPILINLDPWGIGGLDSIQGDYRLVDSELLQEVKALKPMSWDDRMPGLRFYGKFRTALADWINAKFSGTRTIDHGAILQRLSRTEREWKYMIERCKPPRFAINDDVLRDYEKLLSGKHPPIVFILSPIAKPWYDRWNGQGDLADLLVRLSRYPNTYVIDLCTPNIGAYDLEMFMDLTHLNEKGARRFSKELKEKLASIH